MGAANNVQLIGRITRDVEVRKPTHEGGQAAASFTLAVDRDVPKHRSEGQQNSAPTADFISCAAFGARAEALANYTAKGSLLAVHGHIQTRTYKSSEGRIIYVTEVVCDSIRFLETKRPRTDQQTSGSDAGPNSQRPVSAEAANVPDRARSYEEKRSGGYQLYPGSASSAGSSGPRDQSSVESSGWRGYSSNPEQEAPSSHPGDSSRSTGAKDPYPAYPSGFENDDCPF